MKKSIPFARLLEVLDAEPDRPLSEALRRLVLDKPYLAWLENVDPEARRPSLCAVRSYALLHSGGLVTTAARNHHRAVFARCRRESGLS